MVDTNAAFFVGLPLACHYMLWADRLRETERDLLTLIFRYFLKWFEKQARNPNLVYPNKVLSDAALLYTLGRFLNDPSQTAQGIEFCRAGSSIGNAGGVAGVKTTAFNTRRFSSRLLS